MNVPRYFSDDLQELLRIMLDHVPVGAELDRAVVLLDQIEAARDAR